MKKIIGAVGVFLGFMYATAGTAIAPSSAMWTGSIVCSSPFHLINEGSSASYGNTSITYTGFTCVDGNQAHDAGTLAIFGLQFLLGTIIAVLVVGLIVGAFRIVGRAQTQPA